jgi:chorismate mutase / prephenate dehydratase
VADSALNELARWRTEVDRIDDAVIDLLLERIAVVHRIGELKAKDQGVAPGMALRPAREAQIIRRLAARAGSELPAPAVTRMWRELLGATTRLQTPFNVAVLADPTAPHAWALAHDHFGALTPLLAVETAQQGFRLIGAGEAELLVLPAPLDDSYWWQRVALTLLDSPLRIVSRLPFCPTLTGDDHHPAPGALVLGALPVEPSGTDLTMLAVETDLDLSRARLRDLIEAGGVELVSLTSLRDLEPETAFHLVEVEGMADSALSGLQQAFAPLRDRVLRLDVLGSYPQPLQAGGTVG